MMSVPFQQFCEEIVLLGLISQSDLDKYVAKVLDSTDNEKTEHLAKLLVNANLLTTFQVKQVVAGKGRSLVLGNYQIKDKIGAGGMGQVFMAEHQRMKRLVAIKLLPDAVAHEDQLIARFQREVHAAAKLMHPNIVAAFDADEADGTFFFVMEYVPGDDLATIVKRQGELSVESAIDCILDAARGLEYAHSHGVIHRDIKPANLLLCTMNNQSEQTEAVSTSNKHSVKILDMGLARIEETSSDITTQAELTTTGVIMGTVDYMAPEQAISTKNADHRSDIYSLGITLFYLLTGQPAYAGSSVMERLVNHRESPIPSLRNFRSDVPVALDELFQNMLAKKPEDRIQSMTEVIQTLESIKSGEVPDSSTRVVADGDEQANAPLFMGSTTLTPPPDEAISKPSNSQTDSSAETIVTKRRGARLWLWPVIIGGALMLGVLAMFPRNPEGEESSEPATGTTSQNSSAIAAAALDTNEPVLVTTTTKTALQFDGNGDRLEIANAPFSFEKPFTLEMYLQPDQNIDELEKQRAMTIFYRGPLAIYYYAPNHQWMASIGQAQTTTIYREFMHSTSPGEWAHLVLVWDGNELFLYVNGEQGYAKKDGLMESLPEFLQKTLPANKFITGLCARGMKNNFAQPFRGIMAGLRISSIARSPKSLTGPLTSDSDTELLYLMNEGNGKVLKDSSGNGHDGLIHGARWVNIDATKLPD